MGKRRKDIAAPEGVKVSAAHAVSASNKRTRLQTSTEKPVGACNPVRQ
jgi:hypothetical protein